MIFTYALDSADLYVYYNIDKRRTEFSRDDLHLPRVCRQVHCETKHLVDNFLWVTLDGNSCVCAWGTALSRQGHNIHSVREFRLSSTMTTEIEEWVDDHDEGFTHSGLPFLQKVVCESARDPDDITTAMRTLFDKADLEVVHTQGE